MPAAGSHRSSSARANCGLRPEPGAILTSMIAATAAERSRATVRSAASVPWPYVRSAVMASPGEANREGFQAVDQAGLAPAQPRCRDGQRQEAGQQRADDYLALQPG